MNGIRFSGKVGITHFDGATLSVNSLLPMGHSGTVNSAAYSPDGRFIVTASLDNTARIWNSETGERVRTLEGHNDSVHSAIYSPDGGFIVTASRDRTARIWNSETGEPVRTLEGPVTSAAFSPDGRFVVATFLFKPKFAMEI